MQLMRNGNGQSTQQLHAQINKQKTKQINNKKDGLARRCENGRNELIKSISKVLGRLKERIKRTTKDSSPIQSAKYTNAPLAYGKEPRLLQQNKTK